MIKSKAKKACHFPHLVIFDFFQYCAFFSEEIKRRNNIRKVCQVENGVIDILDANNSKCLMITVQDYSEDPDVDQIDSGTGF